MLHLSHVWGWVNIRWHHCHTALYRPSTMRFDLDHVTNVLSQTNWPYVAMYTSNSRNTYIHNLLRNRMPPCVLDSPPCGRGWGTCNGNKDAHLSERMRLCNVGATGSSDKAPPPTMFAMAASSDGCSQLHCASLCIDATSCWVIDKRLPGLSLFNGALDWVRGLHWACWDTPGFFVMNTD